MSRERAKGTRFEREVCEYLAAHGHPHAERRAMRGTRDAGDVAGIPGVVVECKAHKVMDLGNWMNELDAEKANAGAESGALVVKRRAKPAAKAYVVMDLETFAALLAERAE